VTVEGAECGFYGSELLKHPLRDDNLKCVPSLSLTLTYSKDDPVAEIEIS
jgi:hypothetical protein